MDGGTERAQCVVYDGIGANAQIACECNLRLCVVFGVRLPMINLSKCDLFHHHIGRAYQ